MYKSKKQIMEPSNFNFVKENISHASYSDGYADAFKSLSLRIDFYYEHKQRDETDLSNQPKGLYETFIASKFKHWDDFLFDFCFGGLR
jgi:hypothetical protein